jgi:hypothetical protein
LPRISVNEIVLKIIIETDTQVSSNWNPRDKSATYLLASLSESLLFFLDDDPLSTSLDDDFLFREGLAALAIGTRNEIFDDPVPQHESCTRMRKISGHEAGLIAACR